MTNKTVTVKLVKSVIGATQRQRATIKALGLRRLRQEVTLPANDAVMGMISAMQRWLEVK